MDGAQPVLENHAIGIHQQTIVGIYSSEQAKQFTQAQHQHLPQHALIPGLINAHGHAAMSLLRGYADDTDLMTWLNQAIWPAEGRWVSRQFVRDGADLAIVEMLASGTTCFSDMYFFPDQTVQAAVDAGIRAHIAFPIIGFATAWASDTEAYLHQGLAIKDEYRHQPRISFAFGAHSPYTLSDAELTRILTLAEELDAGIHIHLQETAAEISDSLRDHGLRPIQRLQKLGLLSPKLQCVHMAQCSDDDIQLLKDYGCHVIHCPASNMKLASGACPSQALLDAGVNVGLGTDGAASNNNLDLIQEARLAAYLGKHHSNNAAANNAYDSLAMATINSAKALGLSHQIGSLEIGKQADMVAIDLSSAATSPSYNPISQIIYASSGHHVTDVWVAGKNLIKNRQFTTLNTQQIVAKAQQWQDKITAADQTGSKA